MSSEVCVILRAILSSKKHVSLAFMRVAYFLEGTLKTCLLALWVFREWHFFAWAGMTATFSLEIHSSAVFFYLYMYPLPVFRIFWFCYTVPPISVHSAEYACCVYMAFHGKSVCVIWVFLIVEIFGDDRQLYTWDNPPPPPPLSIDCYAINKNMRYAGFKIWPLMLQNASISKIDWLNNCYAKIAWKGGGHGSIQEMSVCFTEAHVKVLCLFPTEHLTTTTIHN